MIPSLLSLIRAGNSNAHSEERSTYVCALCYANGRTTDRHAHSALTPCPIYSRARICHGSRDKVQSEVYDVVTDSRPRLVAPHPRETRHEHHRPVSPHPPVSCIIDCVGTQLDTALKARNDLTQRESEACLCIALSTILQPSKPLRYRHRYSSCGTVP